MDVFDFVKQYKDAGFTPFPLSKMSKKPPLHSKLETVELDYQFSLDSNIGLFPGSPNGLFILDADDEISKQNITQKLIGLGLNDQITIVDTPRKKGKHYYLKIMDVPKWAKQAYNLPEDIGRGEIRLHRNAYVVAPGSVLHEGEYKFIQGSITEFLLQPVVEWKDITWCLNSNRKFDNENIDILYLPVRLIHRPYPNSLLLLPAIEDAKKGEPINKLDYITGKPKNEYYKTRSEAEAGLITGLILNGWTFEEIQNLFDNEKSGHYADYDDQNRYLRITYNNIIRKLTSANKRIKIANAYRFAQLCSWSGNSGEFEQKTMLALLSKGWQFNTYIPKISIREISEHGGMGKSTGRKGIKRLADKEYIRIIQTDYYKIGQYDLYPFINKCQNENISPLSPPQGTNVPFLTHQNWETSELWSRNLLGGSCRLVYTHLSKDKPIIVSDLMKLTGKCRNTIKTALKKLLSYYLAKEENGKWILGFRDLEDAGRELEAKEQSLTRQNKHDEERRIFNKIYNEKS